MERACLGFSFHLIGCATESWGYRLNRTDHVGAGLHQVPENWPCPDGCPLHLEMTRSQNHADFALFLFELARIRLGLLVGTKSRRYLTL